MSDTYMTIYETRRKNLRLVLDRVFGGVQARLAAALGVTPGVVNRLLPEAAVTRNIGDSTARRIEEIAGLPTGWMDSPHDRESELFAKLQQLPPRDQATVQTLIESLLRRPGETH